MTEREPQDLYEALRRKLDDYGSPPPPDLWATLEQQLPRARQPWHRAYRLAVLACLLLLLIPTTLLLRHHRLSTGQVAAPSAAATSPAPATEAPAPGALAGSRPTAPQAGEAAGKTRRGRPAGAVAAADVPAAARRGASPRMAQPITTGTLGTLRGPADSSQVGDAATQTYPPRRIAGKRLTGRTTSVLAAAPGRSVSRIKSRHPNQLSVAGPSLPIAENAGIRQPTVGKKAGARPGVPRTASPKTGTQRSGSAGTSSAYADSSSPGLSAGSDRSDGVPALPTYQAALVVPAVHTSVPWSPVRPDSLARLPAPARRSWWVVSALAGPGLTYQQLQGRDSSANPLAQLERPAIGYAAQLSVGYALSPRWLVQAGVGYTEYATQTDIVLNKVSYRRDSTRLVRFVSYGGVTDSTVTTTRYDVVREEQYRQKFRDTYRYVSLPVQVRYRLGQHRRWTYDATLGAALSMYVGGKTTTGTSCACEQLSWRVQNSPFRLAGATLLASVGVGYQLSPRWTVQVQPAAQYFITSINKSGLASRQPMLLGLQTGLRLDLP